MSSQIEAEDHGNTKKKKQKKNKKRFSEEQIKSLESIFESETKLEPTKKMEIATKLGLQPRQIAIWFQNKRARWKSKQIEQDYSSLLANYQKLASSFDSLNNERQSLIVQLEKLNKELEESNTNSATCNNDGNGKVENDTNEAKLVVDIKGRDNNKVDSEYRDQEDGSLLVSNNEWQLYNNNRLDSQSQSFDLTCTTSQWFNFWTT